MFGNNKETITLNVEGMSCAHCAAKVEAALKAVNGVKAAKVDLAAKTATVTLTKTTDRNALNAAVEEAGFRIV